MKVSLLFKYIASYVFVVLSALTVLNTIGQYRIIRGITDDRVKGLQKEADVITESYMEDYYGGSKPLLDVYRELQVVDAYSDARIMIVSPTGEVLSDTRGYKTARERERITLPSDLLARDRADSFTLEGIIDDPVTVVVHPVDMNLSLHGYVVLMADRAKLLESAAYYMDTLNICFLIIALVFMLVISFLYFISIVPLRECIRMAREYAKGNFTYEPPKHHRKRNDEFADLTATIDYMGNDIGRIEEYQRGIIANVSHDFRSPLTSIRGFAEAMRDGTIPPELFTKYLSTIIYETERLTKLTEGILELGKFDSRAIRLTKTDFDINSVIKHTAETFEGTCRPRGIYFNLTFEGETLQVHADQGRIEQVIYNLTDNAVKFSKNGSSVDISTSRKGAKVFVSVKDHGVGIPPDKIKKIWERFYKTDTSRGRERKGNGLGLSIVKEIMTAHGEEINVVSTEGAGTEFIFTLPASGGEEE